MISSADRWTPAGRRKVLRHAARVSRNVAATCRLFGLSRTTFYNWARRRESEGSAGLRDKSRRPHGHSRLTPPTVVAKIIYLRRVFGYSPEKIRKYLAASFGIVLSGPGVWKILRRVGLNRRPASARRLGTAKPWPEELHVLFVEAAIGHFPFRIGTVETEALPEWLGYFHSHLTAQGIDHVLATFPKNPEVRRIVKTDFSNDERRRLESGWIDDPDRLFADKLCVWESLYKIGR
jgi:transposase